MSGVERHGFRCFSLPRREHPVDCRNEALVSLVVDGMVITKGGIILLGTESVDVANMCSIGTLPIS